jgi:hypothetical protein
MPGRFAMMGHPRWPSPKLGQQDNFLSHEVWFFRVVCREAIAAYDFSIPQGISDAHPHRHSFPDLHGVISQRG